MAAEGARVAVADRNGAGAERVAREIAESGGSAIAVQVDVANESSVVQMVGRVVQQWSKVDILVNNAALFSELKLRPFVEIPLDEWEAVLHVNVTGVYLCCKAVFNPMRRQGYGKIINVSSAAWLMGRQGYLHYVTSKAAVVGLTRALAREVGPYGITVNCIAPGATVTEVPRQTVSPEQARQMIAQRCIQRERTPADVVGLVVFLASSESDFISGQTFVVDGGLWML
jgi:3-oxoacyl-[acyl-carrier protein] reductase